MLTSDIAGSLLLGVLAGSLNFIRHFEKHEDCSFYVPSLNDAQVYGQKFKSEYLESQFYKRFLRSEPSNRETYREQDAYLRDLDFFSGISSCEHQTFDMMKSQLFFVDSVYS